MDEVYVVEVATTGPNGAPNDGVVQIGICRMLPDGSDFDSVYSGTVCIDPRDIGSDSLNYLSERYGIMAEHLYAGEPSDVVIGCFQDSVFGKDCTSFNVANVFGKHLNYEPWDATRNLTLLPSICSRLDPEFKARPEDYPDSIVRAYRRFCPEDPAEVGEGRGAMELSMMSVSVLMQLRQNGFL